MAELAERMTGQEFGEWLAFLAEEPAGPAASHLHMAHLLAALANGPLKPPQGRPAWRAADFLPKLWQPPPEPAADPARNRASHAKALQASLARMVPTRQRRKG